MRHFRQLSIVAWALSVLTLDALPCLAQSGRLWQGQSYPAAEGTPARTSRFLVLDSGGSGGMFGKGDVRQALHDVFFWNERLGWACGYGGAFKSTDGGLTWERRKPKGSWHRIAMVGPQELWLLEGQHPGGIGKVRLWHSTDDGANWDEVLLGKLGGYLDLYCHGAQRWVLCGRFPTYRSEDGGTTWKKESFGGLLQSAIRIAIPADVPTPHGFTAYALGSFQKQRRLVRSDDGGKTWAVLTTPPEADSHRYQVFFATSRLGWLSGPDGRLCRTEDGGASWQPCDLSTDQYVQALWFDDRGRGYAAVANGDWKAPREALFETRDGGRTWTVALAGAKNFARIFALGPGRLWAVGNLPSLVPNDVIAILDPYGL